MNSRKLLLFSAILIPTLLLSVFLISKQSSRQAPIPQGKIHEIVLTENGFTPEEITIKPGDSIKFTTQLNQPFWPASDLHPTHGIYPEFDPQEPIEPTNYWTFQFLKTGKWKYHDHLQPIFRGIVRVQ